jgi:hypothetical protein
MMVHAFIDALGRLRQEDEELKAGDGYIVMEIQGYSRLVWTYSETLSQKKFLKIFLMVSK